MPAWLIKLFHSLGRKLAAKVTSKREGITQIPDTITAESRGAGLYTQLREAGFTDEALTKLIKSEKDIIRLVNKVESIQKQQAKKASPGITSLGKKSTTKKLPEWTEGWTPRVVEGGGTSANDFSKLKEDTYRRLMMNTDDDVKAFGKRIIENKQDIVVQDPLFLSPLSYFLAPHSKLLINLKGFIPPLYLQTTFSSQEQSQDYAFLINYNEQQIKSPRVVSTKDSPDKGIICETENNVITKIKEDGKEIFLLYNNKFYQNTSNSNFLKTKGNIQIQQEELNLRSKLLLTLAKGNIPKKDLRKVISIYYDKPTAVLRKAGII